MRRARHTGVFDGLFVGLVVPLTVAVALAVSGSASAQTGGAGSNDQADRSRVAAELIVGLLPAAIGLGIGFGMWQADLSSCGPDSIFCGLGGAIWGWIAGVVETVVLTPVITGILHVATGGRGRIGWMLLGGLIGLVGGGLLGIGAGTAIYGGNMDRAFLGSVVGHLLAELGYVSGLVIALEASHSDAVGARGLLPVPPSPYGATSGWAGSF